MSGDLRMFCDFATDVLLVFREAAKYIPRLRHENSGEASSDIGGGLSMQPLGSGYRRCKIHGKSVLIAVGLNWCQFRSFLLLSW